LPEKDHIIPLATGGKDMVTNLQLLHRHCHDTKTAQERKAEPGGTRVKSQLTEERNEGKLSRSVLETSGSGD